MLKRVTGSFIVVALFLLQGCAASVNEPQLHVFNGLVTNGGSGPRFEEIPMTVIQQKDNIYVITHVRWEPVTANAGVHYVVWKWYSGDKLVATRSMKFNLEKTPYRFWHRFSAGSFDLGHYRVDVLIDGEVVDTQEYDVVQ